MVGRLALHVATSTTTTSRVVRAVSCARRGVSLRRPPRRTVPCRQPLSSKSPGVSAGTARPTARPSTRPLRAATVRFRPGRWRRDRLLPHAPNVRRAALHLTAGPTVASNVCWTARPTAPANLAAAGVTQDPWTRPTRTSLDRLRSGAPTKTGLDRLRLRAAPKSPGRWTDPTGAPNDRPAGPTAGPSAPRRRPETSTSCLRSARRPNRDVRVLPQRRSQPRRLRACPPNQCR